MNQAGWQLGQREGGRGVSLWGGAGSELLEEGREGRSWGPEQGWSEAGKSGQPAGVPGGPWVSRQGHGLEGPHQPSGVLTA